MRRLRRIENEQIGRSCRYRFRYRYRKPFVASFVETWVVLYWVIHHEGHEEHEAWVDLGAAEGGVFDRMNRINRMTKRQLGWEF